MKQLFHTTMQRMRRGMGLGDVPGVALSFVLIATIFVVGYLILAGLGDSTTNASADAAVANFTLSMNNIIGFAPTWGVVIGAVVLIGIVLGAFYFGKKFTGSEL